MKMIVRYQAEDGKIFEDAAQAQKYEAVLNQVKAIPLENYEDDTCSFANGGGYIQQKKEVVELAEKELLRLANEWFEMDEKPFDNPRGFVGRYIDDSDMRALSKLYHRIMCTDSQYREWGQPFYAIHPHKAKDIKLN